MLENCVFVGGMERAGTTAIYNYLTQTAICQDFGLKEPSIFNLYDAYGEVQLNWDRLSDICLLNNNVAGNGRAHRGLAIDATPLYLSDPISPVLIKEFVKVPYFVFVLRNPAARFLSDLKWVATQERDLDSRAYQRFALKKSLVADSVVGYLNTFSRESVLVVNYEDLRGEPENVTRSICEFLGVDYKPLPVETTNAFAGARAHPYTYKFSVKLSEVRSRWAPVNSAVEFVKRWHWLSQKWHDRIDKFDPNVAVQVKIFDLAGVRASLVEEVDKLASKGFLSEEQYAQWSLEVSELIVDSEI